jgi:cytochrome c oxidase subunit I+III
MAQRPNAFPAEELDDNEDRVLERTWQSPGGFFGWLSNVHHQAIGKRFIVTAFIFFLLGGILAALMRLQLARPESHLLGPDLYNQLFTMHGTTMMFLFAVPIMQGLGVYLVPLMVGTRNIAFPRLNNFSYFVYLFGGIML